MSQHSNNNGCLWALVIVLLCPWLIVFVPVLFGLFMGLFGIGMGILGTGLGLFAIVPAMLSAFLSSGWICVLMLSVLVAVVLPVAFLIYAAIRLIRGNGLPRWQTWLLVILIWMLSLCGIVAPAAKAIHEAGGINALEEQLNNQTQVWEYSWSNDNDNVDVDEDVDEDDNDNDDDNWAR